MQASPALPTSYHTLPFKEIPITHVPESSPTPTKAILLKLNRPQRYNAVTTQMIEELEAAYKYFDANDRIKAIVVTGSGKAFCAGEDLQELKGNPAAVDEHTNNSRRSGRVTLAIHNCRKPIVMAINGPAAGFGITLTLAATIRIACADSKIAFAFSRPGLAMEACSSYFLPRLVGMSRALHLVTTSTTYTASDPLLRELFSDVLPTPEETLARASQSPRRLRHIHPHAEGAHLLESKVFLGMLLSKDSKEGMKSFAQRRNPDFKATMPRDAPIGWP
ncbi:hypothetical protein AJ80_01146 [Polytolypa hystricis UAMH7299]|uniref:Enoyl-CoA hydratase n=1 Tax=Polytolypa hystricis (strain UAMH7299) TaxID=1447883 RepID=A0A2B7Z1S3_POLH7|nr:hypothetical protein AJ80_01146 [Polytolypa hystricis UAMH7299]